MPSASRSAAAGPTTVPSLPTAQILSLDHPSIVAWTGSPLPPFSIPRTVSALAMIPLGVTMQIFSLDHPSITSPHILSLDHSNPAPSIACSGASTPSGVTMQPLSLSHPSRSNTPPGLMIGGGKGVYPPRPGAGLTCGGPGARPRARGPRPGGDGRGEGGGAPTE